MIGNIVFDAFSRLPYFREGITKTRDAGVVISRVEHLPKVLKWRIERLFDVNTSSSVIQMGDFSSAWERCFVEKTGLTVTQLTIDLLKM